jgi:plasmid replication initiation protein
MEQKIKELKLIGTELVVQNNELLDSPKMLNLQEQKLFLFLVSKLDPDNPDDIVFRISIKEFAKAIGVESTTDIYRDVRKAIKHLMSRIVSINRVKDRGLTTTDMPILGYAEYWHGKGYADIKISEEIAPYLFCLKKEFTQYRFSQITKLSSLYAIRIYEMLKKQEVFGKRTFFIDDLRKKLSITHEQYKKINDFKTRVLEISKREINLKTDLKIDFEFIKTGRKITAVRFDIRSKDEKTETQKGLYCINNEKDHKQVREVMQFGYSASQAMDMLDHADNLDAENAIKAVKNQMKKGNAKNPKAMIKTALKEKWNIDEGDSGKKKNKTKIEKSTSRKTGFMKIFEYFFTK